MIKLISKNIKLMNRQTIIVSELEDFSRQVYKDWLCSLLFSKMKIILFLISFVLPLRIIQLVKADILKERSK